MEEEKGRQIQEVAVKAFDKGGREAVMDALTPEKIDKIVTDVKWEVAMLAEHDGVYQSAVGGRKGATNCRHY